MWVYKKNAALSPFSFRRGITFLELVLVIVLLAVVGSLSVPLYYSFQETSRVSDSADEITKVLRKAQNNAINGFQDDAWGVYFDIAAGSFTLYKGVDYASRDQAFDINFNIGASVNVSYGIGENFVNFEKSSGMPSSTGSITLSSSGSGFMWRVNINSEGSIGMQRL